MDTDKANENLSTIQIPCRMDERGVLPVTNLSVHRCALAAEMVLLASCSQEDDGYDNADMYTLAEMGTRLGGGDPGSGGTGEEILHSFILRLMKSCQIPLLYSKRNLHGIR